MVPPAPRRFHLDFLATTTARVAYLLVLSLDTLATFACYKASDYFQEHLFNSIRAWKMNYRPGQFIPTQRIERETRKETRTATEQTKG
jgi:hypothetical protein